MCSCFSLALLFSTLYMVCKTGFKPIYFTWGLKDIRHSYISGNNQRYSFVRFHYTGEVTDTGIALTSRHSLPESILQLHLGELATHEIGLLVYVQPPFTIVSRGSPFKTGGVSATWLRLRVGRRRQTGDNGWQTCVLDLETLIISIQYTQRTLPAAETLSTAGVFNNRIVSYFHLLYAIRSYKFYLLNKATICT